MRELQCSTAELQCTTAVLPSEVQSTTAVLPSEVRCTTGRTSERSTVYYRGTTAVLPWWYSVQTGCDSAGHKLIEFGLDVPPGQSVQA